MKENEKRLSELEAMMASPDFWSDKNKAQELVQEYQNLKEGGSGDPHDAGNATLAILAGAGGDDAEDFARMLRRMYEGYAAQKGWRVRELHANENDQGGYRNVMLEITGASAYGRLKHEAGVHRLVRQSPFNANAKRQTSFALVEVLPEIDSAPVQINPADLRVDTFRSSGPGGQNVNKLETAVRVTHIPTNTVVAVQSERSQAQNKDKAMALLRSRLSLLMEEHRVSELSDLKSKIENRSIEWGSQIRSYVLNPYKQVKDHRTGVESSQPEKVLAGELEEFIEAEVLERKI